jgi:hypothetical protein
MTSLLPFGSKLSLLLCLLLMPRVGLAAELVPRSSGLPGTAEPAPLRLTEDALATPSERPRPPLGLRLMAEAGVGVATGLGLGLAGSLAGAGLCATGIFGPQGDYFPCFGQAAIGALLGLGTGIPLGVFWGGQALGGQGELLGPVLGLGAGIFATIVLAVALPISISSLSHLLIIPGLIIPGLVGFSMLGYEFSQRDVPTPQAPGAPALASARPRLQPVLAFSSRGMLVGLGGSF